MPSPVIRSLRTTSTRRLVVACLAAVGIGGSATAIAIAATASNEVPPPKGLAEAVHAALSAPEVEGVTARITFTNKLIDGGSVHGANPLLTGATGRLWIGADDRFRLELQSDGGDAQIFSDGRRVTVYDGASNQAWTTKLPRHKGAKAGREHKVPTIARIQKAINRLVKHVGVSEALPTNVGGQPAYTLRITPEQGEGGLVAAAELAWDAVRGVPLRAAVYAVGNDSPVLELAVSEIEYGPVAADAFNVALPEGAEVTKIKQRKHARHAKRLHGKKGKRGKRLVRGVDAVAAKLPFTLSAPDELAGLKRSGVKLLGWGKHPAALVTYGEGLGGIAVVQRAVVAEEKKAKARKRDGGERNWHGDEGLELPAADVGGAQAQVLPTALGTAVTFERDGVHYLVVGSVRQDDALAAARGL